MQPTATRVAELIVYACPTGPLAAQVEHFYQLSLERYGANSAHAYPPHITLTGFFHDEATTVPSYCAALSAALMACPRPSEEQITIVELATTEAFHGLLIVSPWLEALIAAFAERAVSATRRDALRLKSNLHLSLAYHFRPEHSSDLGALARAMVDPAAAVAWELRFYERNEQRDWLLHGAWPLP